MQPRTTLVSFLVAYFVCLPLQAKDPFNYKIDGKKYTCMETEDAGILLQTVREKYPLVQRALEEANGQIGDFKIQVKNLEDLNAVQQKTVEELATSFKLEKKKTLTMQDSYNNRWMHYTLFTVGGVSVGVTVTLLVVWLVKK